MPNRQQQANNRNYKTYAIIVCVSAAHLYIICTMYTMFMKDRDGKRDKPPGWVPAVVPERYEPPFKGPIHIRYVDPYPDHPSNVPTNPPYQRTTRPPQIRQRADSFPAIDDTEFDSNDDTSTEGNKRDRRMADDEMDANMYENYIKWLEYKAIVADTTRRFYHLAFFILPLLVAVPIILFFILDM